MGVLAKSIQGTPDDTPMMQQYQGIKREYPDSILFFRMGDFYEMFNDDAKIASSILQIALTARNKKSNPVPMCGIPHHSANAYITRLLKAGKKVAICEQTEDAKEAKGLVRREVVRVITPGTLLDDNILDPKCDQFIAALYFGKNEIGLSVLDVSTGVFKLTQIDGDNALSVLGDELQKLEPREIIIPDSLKEDKRNWLPTGEVFVHTWQDRAFSYNEAYRNLIEHFKTQSLEGFGCENMKAAISSAGALIHYLRETQKSPLEHITTLTPFPIHKYMALDQCTLSSLELVQSSDGTRKNSLLDLLDLSQTPMGARRIREWILKPLIDFDTIQDRLNSVEGFTADPTGRKNLRDLLKQIFDLERLLGRITLSACNARDLIALKTSLKVFPDLLEVLKSYESKTVRIHLQHWDKLEDIHHLIDSNIEDDPPLGLKEGNMIKAGCNEELDRLKNITRQGKNWIAALELEEKEKTGIPVLKVGFNKIYGYYIEVTKKHADRVPAEYIRKQSLVNAERFISPKLKEYEEEITGAEEKIFALELSLFEKIRAKISLAGSRIQGMARIISEVDALSSFAETAHRYNYCHPEFTRNRHLIIENGRHPLIERIDPSIRFISNDTFLDSVEQQIIIITGPNMAGKSTYLRQVALITLMAQIGSFVPADKVCLGVTDRIFSRVGAQDHLLKGQSTFMVEMNETANILNNATPDSLIILDEIGRGTSTFDGISIAWAIVEYLHKADQGGGPRTLFATHYHELTDLSRVLSGVKNYNVQVKEWNDEIIFLRKIIPGGTDKSYGIQVARLAGLPKKVLDRAHEVLFNLEQSEFDEVGVPKISHSENCDSKHSTGQLGLFPEPENPLIQIIKGINPNELSPREALDILFKITEQFNENSK
jgi:DNA mismatch repair protein MutS